MNKNEEEVKKLLKQYKEYLNTHNKLETVKQKKLQEASLAAKKEKVTITMVLKQRKKYDSLAKLDNEEIELHTELQNISDSMFYPNHIVWMMYKHKAYQKTSQAINTWLDLKNHCSPEDYICTKRFSFLMKYVKDNYNIEIIDKKYFPDEMPLEEAYKGKIMLDLLNDKDFIEKWQDYEYFKKDGKVAKWKNFEAL